MSVDEAVRNSQALLEQISGQPEAVLAALDPGERVRVVDELSALAERASGVQAEADLLYVAEAVHGLIEETPALAALLLPTETETRVNRGRLKTRKLTRDYDDAAYRKSPRGVRITPKGRRTTGYRETPEKSFNTGSGRCRNGGARCRNHCSISLRPVGIGLLSSLPFPRLHRTLLPGLRHSPRPARAAAWPRRRSVRTESLDGVDAAVHGVLCNVLCIRRSKDASLQPRLSSLGMVDVRNHPRVLGTQEHTNLPLFPPGSMIQRACLSGERCLPVEYASRW
jgi:hypothetical protein